MTIHTCVTYVCHVPRVRDVCHDVCRVRLRGLCLGRRGRAWRVALWEWEWRHIKYDRSAPQTAVSLMYIGAARHFRPTKYFSISQCLDTQRALSARSPQAPLLQVLAAYLSSVADICSAWATWPPPRKQVESSPPHTPHRSMRTLQRAVATQCELPHATDEKL